MQDSKYYTGDARQQFSKVKRGGMAQQRSVGPNKNRNKPDEYSAEFPDLDGSKSSKSITVENPTLVENSGLKQQYATLPVHEQEKNSIVTTSTTGPSQFHEPSFKTSTKYAYSPTNRNHYQDQRNGRSPTSSSDNKIYFNRSSGSDGKEQNTSIKKDCSSPETNFLNQKPLSQHNNGHSQHQYYKQQHYNIQGTQGYNQHNQHTPSAPRGRNFNQYHNIPQQYNCDGHFAKRSAPLSSSNPNRSYDQQYIGGHNYQYNNRQC